MIYLDENGVTVKAKSGAKGAQAGEIYELNGKKYYVAIDQYDLQKIVKNKSYQNIPLNRIVTRNSLLNHGNLPRESQNSFWLGSFCNIFLLGSRLSI